MTVSPVVQAIVLNWNGYEHSRRCLQSLAECGDAGMKVIIVDNASHDGSGARLQAEFPQHRFIANGQNLGFARGCNVGIRAALQDEPCHYVLLINNDAMLMPGGLSHAVSVAQATPGIGLIGGKVLQSLQTRVLWYAGGTIDRWRGQAMVRGFGEVDRGQYDTPEDVGFVTGGLMLIRREVLDRVGLLPEEYFFGVEEWDYSLSVRTAGYRLRYEPAFVALHPGDGSHWNYQPKYVYNYYRNKLIFQEKFLPRPMFVVWKWAFVAYGALLARRRRRALIVRAGERREVPMAELDFALQQAVKDHGTNRLDETALAAFEERLARASAEWAP